MEQGKRPGLTAADLIAALQKLDPYTPIHTMVHDSEWSHNFKYAVSGVTSNGFITKGEIVGSWSDWDEYD